MLTSENEALLVWWDTFFVLYLCLDILNRVRRLNIEGDRLTSQSLDEDLHSTSEAENQVKSRFFLDVVIAQGTTIFELFASEDEALLVWWDSFFVLDFCLDIFN